MDADWQHAHSCSLNQQSAVFRMPDSACISIPRNTVIMRHHLKIHFLQPGEVKSPRSPESLQAPVGGYVLLGTSSMKPMSARHEFDAKNTASAMQW